MNNPIKTTLALALALALAFSQLAHGALWTAGHGDLGIGYEQEGGLELHWHLGGGNEPVTLNGTTVLLGANGDEFAPIEINPVTNLTQNIGGTSYFVFPATENPTVPFIGFGTEELNPAHWTGNLTLKLTGASGPGSFFLFGTGAIGGESTLMDSSDGFSTVDSITLAPDPETHAHYTWAFSQLGTYALTFEVSGTLANGDYVTDSATYTTIVPEPSTAGLLLGAAALALTVVRRRVS